MGGHSLALSPSSHPLLLLALSDAAAGEWACTLGEGVRGEGTRQGGASALPRAAELQHQGHLPASASPAPGSPLLSVVAGTSRTWAELDHVPRGHRNGSSCSFLPPLSQGSRWLGLLSYHWTHRTALSVSSVPVNGALSGWLEQAQLAL